MTRVRVRMYRQGLGDCFLLTFTEGDVQRHVLIDCGVLKGTEDAASRMRSTAENILAATQGALYALVLTHEHWDHLSGFLQAADILEQIHVSEVWCAWTEDPGNDLALELSTRRRKAQAVVASATRQLRSSPAAAAQRIATRLEALLEFTGGMSAAPGKTTRAAMAWAKQRGGQNINYFYPGSPPHTIEGLTGIRVYVLGPPPDRKRIKKSDPSKRSSEVYELAGNAASEGALMAAIEGLASDVPNTEQPFEQWFRVNDEEATSQDFFRERYGFDNDSPGGWRRIEDDWLGAAGALALQLDSDTNNTSLALAFEIIESGHVLLFPADAQVGNWLSWSDLSWTLTVNGEKRSVTARDLLAKTVLYKVGHHGSHNATLRENGLELMTSPDLVAMIPVNRQTAAKMEWNMPFPALIRRLQQRARGRILDLELGIPQQRPEELTEAEWDQFLKKTDVNDGWIDYSI